MPRPPWAARLPHARRGDWYKCFPGSQKAADRCERSEDSSTQPRVPALEAVVFVSTQRSQRSGQEHGDDPRQKNAIKGASATDGDNRCTQRREVCQIEQVGADEDAKGAGDVCHYRRFLGGGKEERHQGGNN